MRKWLPGGCPALVEGRAGNSACGLVRACLMRVLLQDAALPLWRAGQSFLGAPDSAARACCCWPSVQVLAVPRCCAMHQEMLPCPCGGQGNVSKVKSHVRYSVEAHVAPFSLVFLAPKSCLVPYFLMVPCSIHGE
ncbi:uncharacterized protein DS421_5g152060 [Arachis hypogaea]|nr:uncharacterized protein DS421_5g152060 [Arachis hypogaea]